MSAAKGAAGPLKILESRSPTCRRRRRKHPHQEFIQIARPISFHLRRRFDGLEKSSRTGRQEIDRLRAIVGKPQGEGRRPDPCEHHAAGLLKFGLIADLSPLPVICAGRPVEDMLIRILQERQRPGQAVQEAVRLRRVALSFEPGMRPGNRRQAWGRNTGARGLRAILEEI